MNYVESEKVLRRIMSGKLYKTVEFQGTNIDVVFTDPSTSIMAEVDFVYDKNYQAMKNTGILTIEEIFNTLSKTGDWTEDMEKRLSKLETQRKVMQKQLTIVGLKPNDKYMLTEGLSLTEQEIMRLYRVKNSLLSSSLEYLCDTHKKRFLMKKIVTVNDKSLLENSIFLDTLIVCYYSETIEDSVLRQLARSHPWRLYWVVAKDTGSDLFGKSISELTSLQYSLLFWTKLYDFAYENTNRPSNEVIEDDEKFDEWYKEEAKRLNNEQPKTNAKKPSEAGLGGEVFVLATKETAKEVYGRNVGVAAQTVQQRRKLIEKKNNVAELDLPDIKQKLIIQRNMSQFNKGK